MKVLRNSQGNTCARVSFLINPIQNCVGGGGQKDFPPTSFSPVTSANVGISPQNFLTVILTLLPHWCKLSRRYLEPVPNYWTWTKAIPHKKQFSSSNPYKIEVMMTSLIEMLELPNFGHMITFTIQFELRDKILLFYFKNSLF